MVPCTHASLTGSLLTDCLFVYVTMRELATMNCHAAKAFAQFDGQAFILRALLAPGDGCPGTPLHCGGYPLR